MRRRTIIASAIASGVVATALIATPSLAAVARSGDAQGNGPAVHSSQPYAHTDGKPDGRSTHSGMRHGLGDGTATGNGAGMDSEQGAGKGAGMGLTNVAGGTVTAEQTTALTEMAAEEKLAHDLYVAFDEKYDATVFSRIATSETKHLDAVRALLGRYEITDPTVGLAAGAFPTDDTQKLYDTLLAQGSVSLDAAKEAARTVEETDIADLTAATAGVTAPDVLAVYEHLLAASKHHLVAFGG
jgi:hypothetical protein